ncbi:MAG: protein kinase family protein [Elusimicrobia bacterium]|nr:protein kinase family protein [Elusimicrobiota bacterium]
MKRWLLAVAGVLLLTGRPAAAAPLDEAFAAYQAGAYGKAAALFRAAAERGNQVAQYNLALLYQAGEGVARDDAEAVVWFRKAAEQGDAKAQNELGVVLVSGRGTPRDPVEASRWFEKAAAQGNGDAQFNLDALRRSSRTQAQAPGRSWPLSLPQSLGLLAAALIVGWMLLPLRTEGSAAPAGAAASGAPTQGATGGTLLAGKYELRGRIGEGGMGIVFGGHDRALDRRVAVKMLRSEFKAQGQARDDFLREARVVSQLTHPFVIAIHEIVEERDEIYLVFEYVDGESLSAALKRRGRPRTAARSCTGTSSPPTS